jgi:hypothetical protein
MIQGVAYEQMELVPIVISLGIIVVAVIKEVVAEREAGIKEVMKVFGVSTWVHWFDTLILNQF